MNQTCDKLYSARDLFDVSSISFSSCKAFICGSSLMNWSNLSSLFRISCNVKFDKIYIFSLHHLQLFTVHVLEAAQGCRVVRLATTWHLQMNISPFEYYSESQVVDTHLLNLGPHTSLQSLKVVQGTEQRRDVEGNLCSLTQTSASLPVSVHVQHLDKSFWTLVTGKSYLTGLNGFMTFRYILCHKRFIAMFACEGLFF